MSRRSLPKKPGWPESGIKKEPNAEVAEDAEGNNAKVKKRAQRVNAPRLQDGYHLYNEQWRLTPSFKINRDHVRYVKEIIAEKENKLHKERLKD